MSDLVDIGFLEPCADWLLTNKFFRSKVGGKPAWLELKHLPSPKDILCEECGDPCVFLCQIYAPLDGKENCFHRMLFIFVCLKSSCYKPNQCKNIKVYRSQLARKNDYFSFDPPSEDVPSDPVPSPVPLCVVCGCRGPQLCSKCKTTSYCGVVHQRIDWKHGHKATCGQVANTSSISSILFPQYEIVTEPEEEPTKKLSEEDNEKDQMNEYRKLVNEGKAGDLEDLTESELDSYAEQSEDKYFLKFRKRIANDPDQILRYERGGNPLWLSPVVPKNITSCDYCGGARVFECQIMPQLLNSLKNDSIDWGTLAIYTCEQSCDPPGQGYAREYIFKQDVLETDSHHSANDQ
ncbi:programmed cell death protein 2 isoform X2 [Topomyia yanbarensis]|uniref:programmed cell death protein 2 isoform X2 n=1 Tax=Topomyia yanbarensis TaxID=2498891 RepID=UPI00273B160D|nr:programmed cell death protein 2 isoform X2 [Topomyia yanbarensis]